MIIMTASIIIIIICIIKWHKKIPSKEFCGHLGLGYSYFGTVLSKKEKNDKKTAEVVTKI